MGYRKSKNNVHEKKLWDEFIDENKKLILSTGLPLAYIEQKEMFLDFLMHGYIDHHEDEHSIALDEMNNEQKKRLIQVIVKSFELGLIDCIDVSIPGFEFKNKSRKS
jgi:hypothetical protein